MPDKSSNLQLLIFERKNRNLQ